MKLGCLGHCLLFIGSMVLIVYGGAYFFGGVGALVGFFVWNIGMIVYYTRLWIKRRESNATISNYREPSNISEKQHKLNDFSFPNIPTWQNSLSASSISKQSYDAMIGLEFEQYCCNLLAKNGYTSINKTKGSGDHGVDILASKGGYTYAIQCKRYKGKVGNKAIQEVFAGRAFYGADKAIVLTSGAYTKPAEEEAQQLGVQLWSRKELEEMNRY